ncbi:MAG: PIN domain-containing protein [candidate division NC10 bacterium]|nr:PIN domain-containing protein [candidate division NC10 bacterium]MBI4840784.1 PIN domain-containing protein [candidate division NC10 bacterium]
MFLAVIVPEVTRAPRDDIRASERLLRALQKGEIVAFTSVMALAEIRWVFEREKKPGFDIVRATLEDGFAGHLTILPVDADLAVMSAIHRRRYYSRNNPFSYNDGIFLATALRTGTSALVTTDPHLLHVSEVSALRPSAFPSELHTSRT